MIRRRKASSVSKAGSHSRVAPSTCTRVSKAALSTSAIRTPQLSDQISFKTLRILSAMSAGSPYSRKAKGLKPTGQGSEGSITTTSSIRSCGTRSSTSRTRSCLGSITSTLRPALISERIRCCKMVDLPDPVGPKRTLCSRLSIGEILRRFGVGWSMLRAKHRSALLPALGLWYHSGGRVSLGCSPGVPGSSASPVGRSRKLESSFTDSFSGKCHGTWTRVRRSGFSESV